MTREEFITVLKEKRYSYEIQGDKIIVTYGGWVGLSNLKSISPGVTFKNRGHVLLGSLETLPSGVEFKNGGSVYLGSLKTLPPGVHFENDVSVGLSRLKSISPGVHFKNTGDVKIKGLDWVDDNEGIKIEGVENKRLLHLMINKGLFI